jgi:serine/threonine protein kinase
LSVGSSRDRACKKVADIGEYSFGKTLGHGRSGKVRKATKITSGEKFAIKIIPTGRNKRFESIEQEIRIQQRLHHKHVVEIVEVLRKDEATYIVMELVSGGELFNYIMRNGHVQEPEARRLFQQIIAAVEHCHVNQVAHRDLKPENILLDSARNVKLSDFGVSCIVEDGKLLTTKCGSLLYAAPEVFQKNCQYEGPEVDIWSCGVTLFVLLCGHLPFPADSIRDLHDMMREGDFAVPPHVSEEAIDLMKRMLKVEPKSRISLSGVKEHAWFKRDLPADLFPRCPEEAIDEGRDAVEVLSSGKDRR